MTPAQVAVRDVTLRDGLQDEAPIPTEDKVALFEALVAAGVNDLELTSFVRPDRVPALADAAEMSVATAEASGVRRWALALNERGVQRAVDAGLDGVQFVISVSDEHSRHNAGRGVDDAVAEFARLRATVPAGTAVEVTLSTAFGCPYAGPIAPDAVRDVAARVIAAGVDGVSLGDTIGTGIPSEVRGLVRALVGDHPDVPVGVHLHDTRGLGIANALAGLEAGAARVDGAVGGLGGCPFAPGASGNLPLEDLVHLLHAEGVSTGIDLDRLIAAAELACRLTGRSVESHVGRAGPRFSVLH